MRTAATLLIAALAVGLAGCAAPAPEATAPPSPEPTVSETPEPDPVSILITQDEIAVLEGSATVDTVDYAGATADAVAVLTEVFGSDPEVEPYEAQHIEEGDGTSYRWGGFELRDYDHPAELVPPYTWQFEVHVTGAAVGEVAIATVDGIIVGSPLADVVAAGATPYAYNSSIPSHAFYWVDFTDIGGATDGSDGRAHRGVNLRIQPADGPVTEMYAPSGDYVF